jgi:hypothetical protein
MDTSMSLDDRLDKVTCHVLRRLLDGPYGQQIWLVPWEKKVFIDLHGSEAYRINSYPLPCLKGKTA